MDFAFPPEVAQFREEFRRYLDRVVTPELMHELRSRDSLESTGPLARAFMRRLGEDGYLGIGWPKEYGGGGKNPLFTYIVRYELDYRGLPYPLLSISTVGPTLMRVGTEEQKREILPKILRAEITFAVGYTEPEAGTDLASLKTRAVREGDEYVINGQKIFTSLAQEADYIWLACRTDPEAPKHKGISIILVPTNAEGFSVKPLYLSTGGRTNITYYDNVRVPVKNLVGEENRGWYYITTQLDFERVAISPVAQLERVFDSLCDLLREAPPQGNGRHALRTVLAEQASTVYVLKVMDLRIAAMISEGEVPVAEASLIKVLANECRIKLLSAVMSILGPRALLRRDSPLAIKDRAGMTFESQLRGSLINLFGGGNNDIQRDLIANHGLKLPR